MSPRPVTLILLWLGLNPVPIFTDDLIEDVAGVDDLEFPAETTILTLPRAGLNTEEGTRDASIGSNNVLNTPPLNRILT